MCKSEIQTAGRTSKRRACPVRSTHERWNAVSLRRKGSLFASEGLFVVSAFHPHGVEGPVEGPVAQEDVLLRGEHSEEKTRFCVDQSKGVLYQRVSRAIEVFALDAIAIESQSIPL